MRGFLHVLSSEDQTWCRTVGGLGSADGGGSSLPQWSGGREEQGPSGGSQLNVKAEVAAYE